MIASAFVLSLRPDGAIRDWTTDNVLGVILTASFNEACQRVSELVSANLGPIKTVPGGKVRRAHLVNQQAGEIVGVISGWQLDRLLDAAATTNIAVK